MECVDPVDYGDEGPIIVSRDWTAEGGHACCVELLPDGTERLVHCRHRNHVTYTHVPSHVWRPVGIPVAFMRPERVPSR